MADRTRNHEGARGAGAPDWAFRLFPVLLFLLSLAPRLVAVNRYVTPDEPTWVYRSILFRQALLEGRWGDTLVAGHPGVTTTWLGALGLSAQLALNPALQSSYDWLTRMAFLTPDNVEAFKRLAIFLSSGRVAVALVNSLGVVGAYFLARRLWGRKTALVAGLLLALDPFLVGLSGLLHVDGLSTTFATISLLATANGLLANHSATTAGRRWAWIGLGGMMAGLAVLSKTPLLLLLPVSGLALLWPLFRDRHLSLRDRLLAFGTAVIAWGLAFALTMVTLFPALWASPYAVLATLGGSANRHLDEALRETFFMGKAAFDHGPLFYPVVLLWRLSPVVWLGLIPAVWLFLKWRKERYSLRTMDFTAALLLVWAILFIAAITPAAKKFDRYILPVVPSLLLLTALAWANFSPQWRGTARWILPSALVIQAIYLVWFFAYPLLAYNPLVGGPRTAIYVLPVGWGESISAAGSYLSRFQEDPTTERAMAGITPSLAPFFSGQTLVAGVDDQATANYTVITVGGRQLDPVGVAAQTADLVLLHSLDYGGIVQAWIYEQPSPLSPRLPQELADPAHFGDRVSLTAYDQRPDDNVIELEARWRRLSDMADNERYILRIVIDDDRGNIWASQETPLLNEVYFYPPDWESAETDVVRYRLELPPGIPAGVYNITLTLVDQTTGGQIPVRLESGEFLGVAYPAGSVEIEPPPAIISASRMRIPYSDGTTWLDGQLQLLGFGEIESAALAGSRLPVDLFWHLPQGALPDGLQVGWRLAAKGEAGELIAMEPLSRYDTGNWRLGETVNEKYQIPLPPNLKPGDYILSVEPLDQNGVPLGIPVAIDSLVINNIDRLYELSEDAAIPLDVQWEALALLGLSPERLLGSPGKTTEITLFWEKLRPHGDVYTIFIHVIDKDGNILFQADHWPGGLPTDILDGGQIIVDRIPLALPDDMPPGDYSIRAGVYLSEDGRRLPIIGGEDALEAVGDDSYILPVPLQVTVP